jgi:hypothetical protein
MNWRIFYWGVVMLACLGSIATLSASNECLGWAVPLLLAVGGAIYWAGKWFYKYTIFRDDNFKLSILNCLPNGLGQAIIPEPPSLKICPLQLSRLFIEVKATRGFPVKSINFRCIATSDIGQTPVNSAVRVTSIIDRFNVEVVRHVHADGYNGMELEYAEIRGLGKNRALYFELYIDAEKEWSGTISLKARDSDGFCSYGRYAIAFGKTYDEAINGG